MNEWIQPCSYKKKEDTTSDVPNHSKLMVCSQGGVRGDRNVV